MTLSAKAKEALEPLDIKCTESDCEKGLHCFMATKEMVEQNQKGICRSCGANLVDWKRVYKRDTRDAAYTFAMLKLEMIRHSFWHRTLDEVAVNHARRKGRVRMHPTVETRLREALREDHPRQGRQTPREGNSIYYAQHATATCCRRCLQEWHDIPQDRPLSDEEISYFTDLCMLFINERLPELTEHGEKIPPRRKPRTKPPTQEQPPNDSSD